MDELKLTAVFDFVDPEELFDTWLDGAGHTEMTGGEATGAATVGAKFTAWDGYIAGQNLELSRPSRIVQSWRTSEFADSDPDSRLELLLEETADGGTRLTLVHTGIPAGQGEMYLVGWNEHYFEPMQTYFDIDDDDD